MTFPPSGAPFTQRYYANGAPTTLVFEIGLSDESIVVLTPTGWPTQFPYWAVIDRSTSTQEVVEVTSTEVSGTHLQLNVTRGADGNAQYSHGASSGIELAGVAQDWAEISAHMVDTSRNDHPLMQLDGTGHDLSNRHSLGVSIPSGTPSTSNLGDLADEGVSVGLSRADHVHGSGIDISTLKESFLPTGSIVAILSSDVAYPSALPSGFLWCDGAWYPQDSYPALAAIWGNAYPPFTSLQTLIGLPSVVASIYESEYVPATDFAVPCLLYWTQGSSSPQWYLSPPGGLQIGWAVSV